MPVITGLAQASGEVIETQGGADGNIETFAEAGHGNQGIGVRLFQSGIAEPGQLCPKEQGHFAINGNLVNGGGGGVGGSGDEGIALGFEFAEAGGGVVGVGLVMAVEGEPTVCTNADVAVGRKIVAGFDGMDVLNPETIAASQDSAGVMGLVDIFQNDGDLTGSFAQDGTEAIAAIFRQKFLKVGNEVGFLVKGKLTNLRLGRGQGGGH